jgi:hypothetical protein
VRPEIGRVALSTVVEPEALELIAAIQIAEFMPVSYGWLEPGNLIAIKAVAEAVPPVQRAIFEGSAGASRYSLYGPPPQYKLTRSHDIVSNVPINWVSKSLRLGNFQGAEQLVLTYEPQLVCTPIFVGYEDGRYYLLSHYGRFVQALSHGIQRLLCIVYYGLDLAAADLGVCFPGLAGAPLRQFDEGLLRGTAAPMVRDFLNPANAVTVPTRARMYLTQLALLTTDVSFDFTVS